MKQIIGLVLGGIQTKFGCGMTAVTSPRKLESTTGEWMIPLEDLIRTVLDCHFRLSTTMN